MKKKPLFKAALALFAALLPLCAAAQTLRGDVNKDGKVDVSDVTLLISYILNDTPFYDFNAANVDGSPDGVVDVSDVTFLINLILDQGSTVPVRTFSVNGVSFTVIRVEPGTFMMGSDEYPQNPWAKSSPAHQVTLTKAYYVCQTEVSQELWLAVMGQNPSGYNTDLRNPVNMITRTDCEWFCNKLEALTGMQFRLPTEAEWEFAARGGNLSQGHMYAGSDDIDEVAWYRDNSDNTLHPVGTKAPNELGLYDMTGNAHEWVQDYWHSYPYVPQTDPCEWESATQTRVIIRGGSIASYKDGNAVVTYRDYLEEDARGLLTTIRPVYTAQ